MTRRRSAAVLSVLAAGLMGAGPAPQGTQTDLAFGASRSEFVTSGSPVYRYRTAGQMVHLGATHRFDKHFTLSGDLNATAGLVTGLEQRTPTNPDNYTAPRAGVGGIVLDGSVALRAGMHFKYAGAELGFAGSAMGARDQRVVPSAHGWVGVPKLAYVWGQTMSGANGSSVVLAEPMVGVGHRGDALTAYFGAHVISRVEDVPPRSDAPWMSGLLLEISPGVRLGAEYARGTATQTQVQADERIVMRIQVEHARKDQYW
jgi:hypothetical protein